MCVLVVVVVCACVCVCVCVVWAGVNVLVDWLVEFYAISTRVVYLMLNPISAYIKYIGFGNNLLILYSNEQKLIFLRTVKSVQLLLGYYVGGPPSRLSLCLFWLETRQRVWTRNLNVTRSG